MLHQLLGRGFGVEGVSSRQAYQGRVTNDPLVRRASVALVNGQCAGYHDGGDQCRYAVSVRML